MKSFCNNIKVNIDKILTNNPILKIVAKGLLSLLIMYSIYFTMFISKSMSMMLIPIVLSVLSSFLPLSIMVALAFCYIAFALYKISIIVLMIYIVVLLLLYLLIFRITSDKWGILFLCVFLFIIKMPYLIPLILGVTFPPSIFIPATASIILGRLVTVGQETVTINKGVSEQISGANKIIINLLANKEILLWIILIIGTIFVVSIVNRLKIRNNKEIALIVGGVFQIILLIALNFAMKLNINVGISVVLIVLSILIAMILLWSFFPFNYKNVEYVEFYDDEYYYYVRAVPIKTQKKDR